MNNGDGYHIYHAHALGVAGNIVDAEPGLNIQLGSIPSKATTSLSHMGGEGSDRVQDFEMKNFMSFRNAYVEVKGRFNEEIKCYETIVSAVVEGLKVRDVVSADRITSKLTARHPKGTEQADAKKPAGQQCLDEPIVSPIGSSFENLKIAGQVIDAEIATQKFHDKGTYSGAKDATDLTPWQLSKQLEKADGQHPSLNQFRKGVKDLLASHEILACSLVNLDPAKFAGQPIGIFGSVIVVPNFGVIHLAELLIQRHSRRLNMLRISMGSPVTGSFVAADTFSNGTTSPPTGTGNT